MSGEKNLQQLLRNMKPVLLAPEYIFATFPEGKYGDGAHMLPIGAFMEEEGLTLIMTKESAEKNNTAFDNTYRCLSLQVHSSLDAVGLTAAMSRVLADAGISANVVAGYFHDHVFVPAEQADEAMALLNKLGSDSQ